VIAAFAMHPLPFTLSQNGCIFYHYSFGMAHDLDSLFAEVASKINILHYVG
jgi:hypothetical protein